uniref:Uncharacterized protein n=1 Tax=Knipowitschia caucasica TaxID=637954 RepID=A0AAV2M9S3_KNICA
MNTSFGNDANQKQMKDTNHLDYVFSRHGAKSSVKTSQSENNCKSMSERRVKITF